VTRAAWAGGGGGADTAQRASESTLGELHGGGGRLWGEGLDYAGMEEIIAMLDCLVIPLAPPLTCLLPLSWVWDGVAFPHLPLSPLPSPVCDNSSHQGPWCNPTCGHTPTRWWHLYGGHATVWDCARAWAYAMRAGAAWMVAPATHGTRWCGRRQKAGTTGRNT